MKLSDYKESTALHNQGAPVAIGDATFYVKRIGTPECSAFIKKVKAELFGPFHKYQDGDDNLLMAHLLTEYLVTNWECVSTEQGEPLPYSHQEARKVFLNKEYWLSLNLILINAANTFENYLYEQSDEDIEALKKP